MNDHVNARLRPIRPRALALRLILVTLIALGLPALFSNFSKPNSPGVVDGHLTTCPDSPNCVSTQATDASHAIPAHPLAVTPEAAAEAIRQLIETTPRMELVEEKDGYFHATATTLIMRFVDDVEFYIDRESSVLQARSASRIGYSDLGANRKRMTKLLGQLTEQGIVKPAS